MQMTRAEWSREFLEFWCPQLLNDRAVQLLVDWQTGENTGSKFNPLATTYHDGGPIDVDSTLYNSAGVRNYDTLVQGLRATAATLNLSYYQEIRHYLRCQGGSADFWQAVKDSPWGTFKNATKPTIDANPNAIAGGGQW